MIEIYRVRLNYPELKRAVIDRFNKHRPHHVVIEDKASGTQLIQDLKSEGLIQVKAYKPPPGNDKIMRLHGQSAKFEGGLVHFPPSAPWLDECIRELCMFPGCKFDDQVDSITQALDYMSTASKPLEIWIKLGRDRTS